MSTEIQKRIWVSLPIQKERWARAVVRLVWNNDISPMPMMPNERTSIRNTHFQLYYHHSVVDELKKELDRLKQGFVV